MAIEQFSRSLPMMLYRALDAVMPRFRQIFSEFGLTEQQWRVLRVLWEQSEVSFNILSETTLIPAPSLVGVIDRLAKQDLVERRRSKDDRRVVFVLATPKGRRLEAQVLPRVRDAYAEFEKSIDATTWRQLIKALDKIAATKQ